MILLWLYRIVARVIHLTLFPYAIWRSWRGDIKWSGRLGAPGRNTPVDIWLHAASVGEMKILTCLVDRLHRQNSSLRFHLTVHTRTAYTQAEENECIRGRVSFAPLDAPSPVGRMCSALSPKMLVLAETEIWPTLLGDASREGIPVILVNGRMTEKSFRQYRLVSGAMGVLMRTYERCFFRSAEDAERFYQLGVPREKGVVAGDMKFDAPRREVSNERKRELRLRIGAHANEYIVVCGSTRDGEEELLLPLFADLSRIESSRIIVAPRHIQRSSDVLRTISRAGLGVRLLSDSTSDDAPVVIIDEMGLLADLYAIASIAIVGGTFVPVGGHNLLEPVWVGTPVLFGPSCDNVAEAARYIEERHLGTQVGTIYQLRALVKNHREGSSTFARDFEENEKKSATAIIAAYIHERLNV